MRWNEGGGVSPDIEDRRGEGGGGFGFGGGGFRLGCGGIILLAILSLVFRKNFFALLDNSGGPPAADVTRSGPPVSQSAEDQQRVKFVSFVIDDVQHTWEREFPKVGGTYQHAKLVLFRDATRSGCGFADAASGPFYCPADQKVYLDRPYYRWRIRLNWPDASEISFGAVGFTQTLRAEPVLTEKQCLSRKERSR